MAATIRHRGPDDQGIWFDSDAGVGLAHRRLSILDLSPAGHQPMESASGRYVIAYNGEVYNFQDIRKMLGGIDIHWRGQSDTEVLLAAVDAWGIDKALALVTGIFAFALWDRGDRVAYLVRDHVGVKPLYYGWSQGVLLFGSELKALKAHPSFRQPINRDAIALYLRYNYIPAPYSIYSGIHKLEPGHILRIPLDKAGFADSVTSRCFWSARKAAEIGQSRLFDGSEAEAVEALHGLLRSSVKSQMVADVPLGAFLSGGIDSSTVVALMQSQSRQPVKTFTIGFTEEGYNEATHAKAVAKHLGTEHTELHVTPQEAMAVIPRLPRMFDEPFSDSSQIPTFLVSELARRHVTVSLSGDGGDELFAGYDRYAIGRETWGRICRIPLRIRRAMASALLAAPKGMLDVGFFWLSPLLNRHGRPGDVGDKLKKAAEIIGHREAGAFYQDLVSHWKNPSDIVLGGHELPTKLTDPGDLAELSDLTHRMMYLDMVSYLPDDILVKVDRTSMSVGLEARVPLLDHRVLEFAWHLPLSVKVKPGVAKWILRQVLFKYVPQELVDRKKMGFGVPIDSWLRGPLRDWAESLLDERRLRSEGYFNPAPIRSKWTAHLSGEGNWHYYLWDVLMFQSWMEAQSHGRNNGG